MRTKETGPNKRYCSDACAVRARIRDRGWHKASFPRAMSAYNRQRAKRHGTDTLINRLRKRFPDLPTVCEASDCDEARVLECAHKPEFKRNGAWRTLDRYERRMFWMLCPTCHRVLDHGIAMPEQLGLS